MALQNFLATVPFLVYNSYRQNYYNVILSYLSKNYIIRGAYDNATKKKHDIPNRILDLREGTVPSRRL